jgi:hypothetical protein
MSSNHSSLISIFTHPPCSPSSSSSLPVSAPASRLTPALALAQRECAVQCQDWTKVTELYTTCAFDASDEVKYAQCLAPLCSVRARRCS